VSVTPILKRALLYGAVVAVVVAVGGGIIGWLVAGTPGVVGALLGAVLAAVYLGLTAGSMLLAGRVTHGDGTSPLFFGIVLGVWVLKLVVFVIAAIWLRGQSWLDPGVFFGAVIVAVIGSLVADIVAFLRARVPYVSDVRLPGE